MKYYCVISGLLITLMLVFVGLMFIINKESGFDSSLDKTSPEISRSNELELEGYINDYFLRKKIVDMTFSDIDGYGSVLAKSIIVYVYTDGSNNQKDLETLKVVISNDIKEQILSYEDFAWVRDYSFDIVFR